MARVYLGLGSNLGDRRESLRRGLAAVQPAVRVTRASSLYETAPWGVLDQPPFLNAVVQGETSLAPAELLALAKAAERAAGREPAARWGPRALDIDILFYDELVLDTPELVIPHPRIAERAFVLVPLAEIGDGLRHTGTGQTAGEMLSAVDRAGVEKVEGPGWAVG